MGINFDVRGLLSAAIDEAVDYYYFDIVRFNGGEAFGNESRFSNAYESLSDLSFSELRQYLRDSLLFDVDAYFDGFVDMAFEDFDVEQYKRALSASGVYDYLQEEGSGDNEADIAELAFDAENRHFNYQRELARDACYYASHHQNEIFERVVDGLAHMLIEA